MKKLSIALGVREKLETDHKNMITDMVQKFTKNQGMFQGLRNNFVALEGNPDMPENRKFQKVGSTVQEQLDWFKTHTKDYLGVVFSIEKTNSTMVMGELVVSGESWGKYSSLELLRLKGVLDKIKHMFQVLPTRPEGELWVKTTDAIYDGRDVYQNTLDEGFTKTTLKRTVIVDDPHINVAPNRPPVTQQIDTPTNTGKYARQFFSGAITLAERAAYEVAINNLYVGVISALEEANNAQLVVSDLGDKVLDYLLK